MTEQIDNWGCPDWRNSEAYPNDSDDQDDWEWRWQFIRRLDWYRELFSKIGKFSNVRWLENEETGVNQPTSFRKFKELDWLATFVHRSLNMDTIWNPRLEELDHDPFDCEVGGVLVPRLPIDETVNANEGDLQKQLVSVLELLEERGLVLPDFKKGSMTDWLIASHNQVYIQFDPSRPFGPQAERAEKSFNEVAYSPERAPRQDRRLWPISIRLIDPEDQGAKPMDIFRKLEGENHELVMNAANEASRIQGMIESARTLQNKQYFTL